MSGTEGSNIEAASMDLYFMYRHAEGDIVLNSGTTGLGAAGQKVSIDDFDMLITGARIQF